MGYAGGFSAFDGLIGFESTTQKRFEVLTASVYASFHSLSTVGDFTPSTWFTQMYMVPLFVNSFLVTATLFGVFVQYLEHKRKLSKLRRFFLRLKLCFIL